MPLYEYQCGACDERFEWLQRLGEGKAAVRCPACGASEVERRLSTFAAINGANGVAAEEGCGRPQCGGGVCAGAAGGDWD